MLDQHLLRVARIRARMLFRWGGFYSWLAQNQGFEAEFAPGEPSFCPAHRGDSGQAFRFYLDAEITGGGICNSCEHLRAADGINLVAGWFLDRTSPAPVETEEAALEAACRIIEQWIALAAVPDVLSDPSAVRLSEWVLSLRPDVAAAYLVSRGIPILPRDLPASLRAADSEVRALVRTRDGRPVTYHAIRLDAQHRRMPGRGAKRTASIERTVSLSGAYVDLTRDIVPSDAGTTLLVAEGVETALAAERIYRAAVDDPGPLSVRALIGGTERIPKLNIPGNVRRILVLADNDHTLPKTFEAAASVRATSRIPVSVLVAPPTPRYPKPDWLDALVERGLDGAVEQMRAALESAGAESPASADTAGSLPTGGGTPGFDEDSGAVRRDPQSGHIQVSLPVTTDPTLFEILNRLVRQHPPQWYWHVPEGCPVLVSPGGAQRPVKAQDAVSWVSEWVECYNARGEAVGTPVGRVTAWFNTQATQAWLREHLRPLVGVLRAPRLLPIRGADDGTQWVFRTEPGYDPHTQTVLHLPDEEQDALERALEMSKELSKGSFTATVASLGEILGQTLYDLLHDFDFDSESSRTAAAAALLTPAFSAAAGNVPMFIVDAPQRGSGKTTLANLIATIWGGSHQFGFPKNDDAEFEKRLGSAFQTGASIIVVDNVSYRLISDTLARVLTDRRGARIRILGTNTVTSAPLGLVFYATGSNVEVQEEIKRRAVPIRIEPKVLDPAARTAFIHPDLLSYAASRAVGIRALVYCCLMAWCEYYRYMAADDPALRRPDLPLFAGFEDWGAILDSFMQAFLPWFTAFLENRAQWIYDGDSQTQSTQEFVDVWWTAFGDSVVRAVDLVQRVLPEAPVVYERNTSIQNLSRAVAKFTGAIRGRRFRVFQRDGSERVVEVQVLPRQFDNRRMGYRLLPVVAHEASSWNPRPERGGRESVSVDAQ